MTELPKSLLDALADRYAIEGEVGEGGMATVYRARDIRHDRSVAIKVLRPELAAVIGAERFLAEIRTTANLQHPHILPLHDSGQVGGSVFYVMPFIEGESLRGRLERERQLPVAEAVQVVLDVAQALDYAHRHGVIHRDIKPENILLHDGRALVADFGIALAATSAGKRMTETGMSLGTPSYMSPEQAMGERALDARTDVYALGCVLYELLVGSPPFVGPTAQSIVAKVLTERPAPPSAARDTVGEAIDDVVLMALSKVPADRQPSAAAFAEALREAARGQGVTRSGSRAVASAASATLAAGRRSSRAALLLGAVIGALVMAAAVWGLGVGRGSADVEQRSPLTFDGKSAYPAISPDGQFVAYRVGSCDGGPEVPCEFSLQMQEIGGARPVVLVEGAHGIGRPRWTADGSQIVFAAQLDADRLGTYVIPRLGGVPRLVTTRAEEFDVHPRADSLVMLSDGWAVVMDLARGQVRDSVAVPAGDVRSIAWSPQGKWFAVVHNYFALTTIRREGGVSDSLVMPFRPNVSWSGDGRHVVAFVAREGTADDLVRVEVDGKGQMGSAPEVLLSKESAVLRGEFGLARDVNRLAIVSGTITLDQWRFGLDGRGAERLTRGTAYYGTPSLTPDGTQIYFARGDALGDNLYRLGPDGREEALTREPYVGGAGIFPVSADGRRVTFSHSLPGGIRLSEMRLPSGDVSHAPAVMSSVRSAVPFGVRGLVTVLEGRDTVYVLDSLGATPRALLLGPGRQGYLVAGGRPEHEVIVAAYSREAESAVDLILRVPVDGSQASVITRVPGGLGTLHLRDDGAIWFSRWVGGERSASLWEIPVGTTVPRRRGSIPTICGLGRVSVAAVAPVAACTAVDSRSDVWVVDGVWR